MIGSAGEGPAISAHGQFEPTQHSMEIGQIVRRGGLVRSNGQRSFVLGGGQFELAQLDQNAQVEIGLAKSGRSGIACCRCLAAW